jgi:hypothetical protein
VSPRTTCTGTTSYPRELSSLEIFGRFSIALLEKKQSNATDPSLRHMFRDEATYGPDTDKFIPERFLKPGVKDPNAAFGFGRRYRFFRWCLYGFANIQLQNLSRAIHGRQFCVHRHRFHPQGIRHHTCTRQQWKRDTGRGRLHVRIHVVGFLATSSENAVTRSISPFQTP